MTDGQETIKFGMGASLLRLEDERFLTGKGRYVADMMPQGALRGFVLRAAMAHAHFRLSGLDEARAMPGVRLVLTAEDCASLGPMPHRSRVKDADGNAITGHPRPLIAEETVRHVGEPMAYIVAETLDAARDAAEVLLVDYEALPVAASIEAALGEDAPVLWADAPGNVAFRHAHGDRAACDAAFENAARIVALDLTNNRLIANYMEPRGCVALPDAEGGAMLAHIPSQNAMDMRAILSGNVLKIPAEELFVVTGDVGGGFGPKLFAYAESALTILAARRLGAPVAWVQERSEHFLMDAQGRDHVSRAEMALDEAGRFLGLRLDIKANVGAYLSQFASFIPWVGPSMATGLYDIPALDCRVTAVYSNTVPLDAYRGAGRPEAAYLIERFVDVIAAETGIDRFELRRRNFIRPEQLPYRTQTKRVYDTGDFRGHLDRALEKIDAEGFSARRQESLSRGRLRGLGVASYVEACAFPSVEGAEAILTEDGLVELLIGTQSNGQGHETAYAQIAAAHLGLSIDRIRVIQGDTRRIAKGGGTGGSRSIPIGAVASDRAAIALAEVIRKAAGAELEAAPEDIELADGAARIVGTDRLILLADLAAR
ncbi:MAG: xanthine dehydrogenase family protein, partial [Hyphomicrobiaceae bacterium]|nr:xanthine dehydrogenase family protein [Hyphomicrobiaceae bacterium]